MTDKKKIGLIKNYLSRVAVMASNSPYWNAEYDSIAAEITDLFEPQEPQEVVCPSCKGFGKFHGLERDEICINCNGTGKVPSTPAKPQPEKPDELKPEIVCLCGSTQFSDAFQKAQFDLTMAGEIVLTIGCNMKTDTELFKDYSESELKEIKTKLDELHKRKIDLADEVLILNVGNYIGESTASEMSYAYAHNKPVRFLNPSKALDFNWNHIENRIWKDTKGGID